jgi:DNA-binding response OmpR family regulator
MRESDVALNRARCLGITRTVLKGEGWETVMDAITTFLGDTAEVSIDLKARVLVADAVREVAELMGKFLITRGFDVTTASTGVECLEILRTDPSIDAVVLDRMLPDKGGMEIVGVLSRQDRRPGLILTSPVADSELARNARRLGAFDFMTKPNRLACVGNGSRRESRAFGIPGATVVETAGWRAPPSQPHGSFRSSRFTGSRLVLPSRFRRSEVPARRLPLALLR